MFVLESEDVHAVRIDSRSATSCDMDFAAQRRDSREMFVLVDFEVVVVVETTPSYSMASPKRLRKRAVLMQLRK